MKFDKERYAELITTVKGVLDRLGGAFVISPTQYENAWFVSIADASACTVSVNYNRGATFEDAVTPYDEYSVSVNVGQYTRFYAASNDNVEWIENRLERYLRSLA